jgi:molybdenum cofactor biosynthesis protein B
LTRVSLVVTSDRVFRGEKEDLVTPLVKKLLSENGHELVYSAIVPNDPEEIKRKVLEACENARIVLATGGTGISPRDVTVDVIKSLSSKEVPGYGELHRYLSYKRVKEKAILSRVSAFVIENRCFVATSPGNPDAVEVSLEILVKIMSHVEDQLLGKSHEKH